MRNNQLSIGFLADILYIKGIICYEEFDAMQKATQASDLNVIVDRMLRSDFNVYKRGEGYVTDSTLK